MSPLAALDISLTEDSLTASWMWHSTTCCKQWRQRSWLHNLYFKMALHLFPLFLCFCPCQWAATVTFTICISTEKSCASFFLSFDKSVISTGCSKLLIVLMLWVWVWFNFWCTKQREKKNWLRFSVVEKPVLEDIHSFKQEQVFI